MKSKRRKVFKPKGFGVKPYEVDNKRQGFSLSAPKGAEITDEMRVKVLQVVEDCSGVLSARINKEDCLIVTIKTIRPAAKASETRTELTKQIPELATNAMLQEAKAAKKRERSAKAAQRSAQKREARDTGYLNRPNPGTSPTL